MKKVEILLTLAEEDPHNLVVIQQLLKRKVSGDGGNK